MPLAFPSKSVIQKIAAPVSNAALLSIDRESLKVPG